MQSPVLERLVGGAVLVGLLLLLALVIGPRKGVRMPDEEGSENPVAQVTLQPAENGIAAAPDASRREPDPHTAAQWLPPGSVPHAPQPTRASSPLPGTRERGTPSLSAPEAPQTPAAAAATQWGAQVGSFAERGNAARLSDWCREQGYDVKIAATTQQSGTLYRVLVGPFTTRDGARSAVAELALRGRNSFVTDWEDQAP